MFSQFSVLTGLWRLYLYTQIELFQKHIYTAPKWVNKHVIKRVELLIYRYKTRSNPRNSSATQDIKFIQRESEVIKQYKYTSVNSRIQYYYKCLRDHLFSFIYI